MQNLSPWSIQTKTKTKQKNSNEINLCTGYRSTNPRQQIFKNLQDKREMKEFMLKRDISTKSHMMWLLLAVAYLNMT